MEEPPELNYASLWEVYPPKKEEGERTSLTKKNRQGYFDEKQRSKGLDDEIKSRAITFQTK